MAGSELHLDRVVIQGDTTMGVDVNKSTAGFLQVRNSYFTEVATGIKLTSTAAFVVASIDNSHFKGNSANGVAGGANSIANITNSVFSNCGVAAASVSAGGSFLNLNSNTIQNSGTGISAVSGAILRTSNNYLYDNTTGISANGASWQSGGDNKVAGRTKASIGSSSRFRSGNRAIILRRGAGRDIPSGVVL